MPKLSNLPSLKELNAGENQLEGTPTIMALPNLTRLTLANNNLTQVNLVDLPSLEHLDLSSNRLKGTFDMKMFSHFTEQGA